MSLPQASFWSANVKSHNSSFSSKASPRNNFITVASNIAIVYTPINYRYVKRSQDEIFWLIKSYVSTRHEADDQKKLISYQKEKSRDNVELWSLGMIYTVVKRPWT